MREGIGVEASLRWVSARFAQRAVEDFFERSQDREFVIDAVTAVEFAAKAVVARCDVSRLFKLNKNSVLNDAQLLVLKPVAGTDDAPTEQLREEALASLLSLISISARDAITVANELFPVDLGRATRLIEARNAAVHLGDVDPVVLDELATDFLSVATCLWAGLGREAVEFWGDLNSIANAEHLTSQRSPTLDAKVRVVLARRHWVGSGTAANRRSRLDFGEAGVRCLACGHGAVLSTHPAGSAPERCVPESSKSLPVEILDCPACGLSLFGQVQLDWAATGPFLG